MNDQVRRVFLFVFWTVVSIVGGVLIFAGRARAGEISQHVHFSSVDAGHATVAPAPPGTIAVRMQHTTTTFAYPYQVENVNAAHGVLYASSFYCAHFFNVNGVPLFGGSQTGTTCGVVSLAPFDGILDFAGTSGHTGALDFDCRGWPTETFPDVWPWKRHRAGQSITLEYAPLYDHDSSYQTPSGVPLDQWPAAEDWHPDSTLDFDLVYVTP